MRFFPPDSLKGNPGNSKMFWRANRRKHLTFNCPLWIRAKHLLQPPPCSLFHTCHCWGELLRESYRSYRTLLAWNPILRLSRESWGLQTRRFIILQNVCLLCLHIERWFMFLQFGEGFVSSSISLKYVWYSLISQEYCLFTPNHQEIHMFVSLGCANHFRFEIITQDFIKSTPFYTYQGPRGLSVLHPSPTSACLSTRRGTNIRNQRVDLIMFFCVVICGKPHANPLNSSMINRWTTAIWSGQIFWTVYGSNYMC